ncbi:MAG: hypothetical protein BA872_10025 [Desulfobacterales bacterium C00003060]|nr:MAG: hypothetical protein BA872_10025 [Desulfobacterales bacterium C00003060]
MFLGYNKGLEKAKFLATCGRGSGIKGQGSRQQNHGFSLSLELSACLEPVTRCFSLRGYVEPQNLFLKDYILVHQVFPSISHPGTFW